MDRRELERKIQDESVDAREKYRLLWEFYYPRLLIYIKSFKKTPNSERDDIVSDILLKAFNNLHKYNKIYSLSTWVYNIAKNYVLDLYRRNNKTGAFGPDEEINEQTISDSGKGDFVEAIMRKDIVEKCRRCVESLKGEYKRLVFLRYYEGLSAKEIAVIEGISHGAVRQRLMAARSHIKKLLGDCYEH
jgi:RNA polymerase sigma-70 factor (ECF subfamily)